MNWIAVIGTLLGAVVGTAGTIICQSLALRESERKDRRARSAELRSELRAEIEAFLEVYQEIEGACNDGGTRLSELSHRMWFRHNRLSLIASEQLQEPLGELADRLNEVYWHGTPDGRPAYENLHEPRRLFRDAARNELADTTGT